MPQEATPRKRGLPHILRRILTVLFLSYAGLCLLAALFQSSLLYHPDRNLEYGTPAMFAPHYEDVRLTASDGVKVHGWFIPAREENDTGLTLLAFHGNAGNVGTALERLRIYHQLGIGVLMVDYHGFGQSGGSPSEENLYRDAEAAWSYLTRERAVRPETIVIMGYSLGGAVASWLAERNPGVAGLVLESTFTKLNDVATELFPWLPTGLILGDTYNTEARLPNMAMPLLVLGPGDQLVPYACGEKLFAEYQGPKTFAIIGDDHNMGFLTAGGAYTEALRNFLARLATPANTPAKKLPAKDGEFFSRTWVLRRPRARSLSENSLFR